MHFNQKLPLSQPEDAFTVGTSPPNVTVHRCCQRQHVSSSKVASLSIPGRFLIPQGRGTITPALPYFANVKVAVIVALVAFFSSPSEGHSGADEGRGGGAAHLGRPAGGHQRSPAGRTSKSILGIRTLLRPSTAAAG